MRQNKPKIAVRPLPKWVMISYAKLWKKFQSEEFNHSQATRLLRSNTSILLSSLRKAGWLTIQLHPSDSRKRVYTLRNPEESIKKIANEAK